MLHEWALMNTDIGLFARDVPTTPEQFMGFISRGLNDKFILFPFFRLRRLVFNIRTVYLNSCKEAF